MLAIAAILGKKCQKNILGKFKFRDSPSCQKSFNFFSRLLGVRVPGQQRDLHHSLRAAHQQVVLGQRGLRVRGVQVLRDGGWTVLREVLRRVSGKSSHQRL